MKKIISIFVVGFLVFSGLGVVALDSNIKNFDLEIINQVNSVDVELASTHTVLGEFFTLTTCVPCKYSHRALKNLYAGEYHPMHYITLVYDKDVGNKWADQRHDELDVQASPTVFWDGPFKKDQGSTENVEQDMAKYNTSIIECGNRNVKDIDLNLTVEWLGAVNNDPENGETGVPIDQFISWTNSEMEIDVEVTSHESGQYNGHLHVYVNEINSTLWDDKWGDPYTHAFLDYAWNEDVTFSGAGTWSDTVNWDGYDHHTGYGEYYEDIKEDNIIVIASIFDEDNNDYADETTGFVAGVGTDPKNFDFYFGNTTPPPLIADYISWTEWGPPGGLNFSETYYWKVDVRDAKGVMAYGDIWSFTTRGNDPPYTPSNPGPEDGEVDVDVDADLNWTSGDPDGDPVTYDVYFGTSITPPKVESNQSGTSYDLGLIGFDTTYYWRIVAWDDQGASVSGPIWSFTTEENLPPNTPSNPDPEDGDTDVYIDMVLSWTGGDPNSGDVVMYDVYFGKNSPPPLVVDDQTDTIYNPGIMDIDTVYYWQIVAEDSGGLSSTSPIWYFTTGSEKNKPPGVPWIDGEKGVVRGVEFPYYFRAVDPGGDDVRYYINWDDGYYNTVTDFYESGETVTIGHTYYRMGIIIIRACAEDVYGAKSDWGHYAVEWKSKAVNKQSSSMPSSQISGLGVAEVPINNEMLDNNPPYAPSNYYPCSEFGLVDVGVNLSWDGGDPDPGDTVTYQVYLDFGPPIATVGPYPWNQTRIEYDPPDDLDTCSVYDMWVFAWDNHDAPAQGDICSFITKCPPFAPEIDGPTSGSRGVEYDYKFKSTSPLESDVYYYIDWGDDTAEETDFHASGEEVIVSHTFSEKQVYLIKARAIDKYGAIGEWGEMPVEISQSVNQQISQQSTTSSSSQNVISIAHSSGTIVNDGSLSGYVNDASGNPIEGALVRVFFHETYEEDYTDSTGYYHVTNIPICKCMKNATASKTGYITEWDWIGIYENTTYDFILSPFNNPPDAPTIDGPTGVPPGTYTYTFKSTDPNGDNVKYYIDWGDTNAEETTFHASGEEVTVSHTYSQRDLYIITARAKDIHGLMGPAGTNPVEISRSSQQSTTPLFFQMLQRLMDI